MINRPKDISHEIRTSRSPQKLLKGGRAYFQRVFEEGKFARGTCINLWLLLIPKELSVPVLGMIVSRKADLRAVGRNLWKRRIREVFRSHLVAIKPNSAIVVQAKKQSKTPACEQIWADMEKLLAEVGGLR